MSESILYLQKSIMIPLNGSKHARSWNLFDCKTFIRLHSVLQCSLRLHFSNVLSNNLLNFLQHSTAYTLYPLTLTLPLIFQTYFNGSLACTLYLFSSTFVRLWILLSRHLKILIPREYTPWFTITSVSIGNQTFILQLCIL